MFTIYIYIFDANYLSNGKFALVVGRGACQTICLGFTSKHINNLLSTYNCNKFY